MRKKNIGAIAMATVMAVSGLGLSGATDVNTAQAASKVKVTNVSGGKLNLKKGGTFTIKAKAGKKKVSFKTGNKKIATVSSKGKVKGVRVGSTNITVSAKKYKSVKVKVNVVNKVSKVSFLRPAYAVAVNGMVTLAPKLTPEYATNHDITYKSSNKKVATVDSNGVVTGQKAGKTTITISSKADNKKKASITIRVYESQSVVDVVDDFYEGANADIFENATLDDYGEWSSFDDLYDTVEKRKDKIVKDAKAADNADHSSEDAIASIFTTLGDLNTREDNGATDLMEYFKQIDAAETLEDFMKTEGELAGQGIKTIVPFTVASVVNDDMNKVLMLDEQYELLPNYVMLDGEWYYEANVAYVDFLEEGFHLIGDKNYKTSADTVYSLQRKLAPEDAEFYEKFDYNMSEEEVVALILSIYYKDYSQTAFNDAFRGCSMDAYMKAAGYDQVDNIVVYSEESMKLLAKQLKATNLDRLKLAAKSEIFSQFVMGLNSDMYGAYADVCYEIGSALNMSMEDAAEAYAYSLADWEISNAYIKKYVSASDKKNVEEMIAEVKNEYRKEIQNCSWMSATTKNAAIEKLDAMGMNALYPDNMSDYLYQSDLQTAKEGGTIVNNLKAIFADKKKAQDAMIGKKVGQTIWEDSPLTVNAFYYPYTNTVYICEGIASGYMYDPNRTKAQNLGGIGTVIGHEISHAFDSNGANFDKNGKYVDWWTSADRAKFEKLQQKVIEYYNTFELIGGEGIFQDGAYTLGENMADLGGVQCAIKLAGDKREDREQFFHSYANAWASIYTYGTIVDNAYNDVHSNDKVRVNAVLPMVDEFYETYSLDKTNGMYVAPENRISIWK